MAVVTNPSIDAKTRGIIVHIVEKIKSQGVFDRFRRECLEELDSKEPYRQLKQRVESHVATFLSKQVYSPSLPKNQLRNSLRTNINQSEVLSKGVDRLLEQVLVEKSGSFYNEIEGLVHDYLSSIGHYNRFDRDKQQKNEINKLSDKEIDDFIKKETTRFLEATEAEEREKGKEKVKERERASSMIGGNMAEKDGSVVRENKTEKAGNAVGGKITEKSSDLVGGKRDGEMGDKMGEKAENVPEEKMTEKVGGSCKGKSKGMTCNSSEGESPKGETFSFFEEKTENPASLSQNKVNKTAISLTEEKTKEEAVMGEENKEKVADALEGEMEEKTAHIMKESTQEKDVLLEKEMEEKLVCSDNGEQNEGGIFSFGALPSSKDDIEEVSAINSQDNSKTAKSKGDVGESNSSSATATDAPKNVDEVSDITTKKADESCVKSENSSSDDNDAILQKSNAPKITEDQHDESKFESGIEGSSKMTLNPAARLTSTSEETDDDDDFGIPKIGFMDSKSEKVNPEVSKLDMVALSDSDITVSSVHTSDLSSLEDSFSDMEFEDFKAMSKMAKSKKTGESGTEKSEEKRTDSKKKGVGGNIGATSDADDEKHAVEDSDFGITRSGNSRQLRRISSDPESEVSSEVSGSLMEEQKEMAPQRRSARVASCSKDSGRLEERDDQLRDVAKESGSPGQTDQPKRRMRIKRTQTFERKKTQSTEPSGSENEKGNPRVRKRDQRITSDSNESEDVKQSKRSKRTIRPTRCYSPSENN